LTQRIIACAIEVHRCLGTGLLEATYEEALCVELSGDGLEYERQVSTPVIYKGRIVGEYRPDLVVRKCVVVEVKSVAALQHVHQAQILSYMRLVKAPVGLLINFNHAALRTGLRRLAI
jgi:GxxExxY protein